MTGPMDLSGLLAPIAGANPAGEDLRYSVLYDQIKSARRTAESSSPDQSADDDTVARARATTLGAWRDTRRLAAEALQLKTKDLQLAVWLVDAEARLSGFEGLAAGLTLLRGLLETYWTGLIPLPDSEDLEPLHLRGSLVMWGDQRWAALVRETPLTDHQLRYSLLHYEASQTTNADKKKALLESGWPTAEQVDDVLTSASVEFVNDVHGQLARCQAALTALETTCQAQFAEGVAEAVSLPTLRRTLDSALWLLGRSGRRIATDEPTAGGVGNAEETSRSVDAGARETRGERPAATSAPQTRDNAVAQLAVLASFLRQDNPYHPLSYLLSRAIAIGQLLSYEALDAAGALPAPDTATRQRLKQLYASESWPDLVDAAETALRTREKQAWLDPYRYSLVALERMGEDYKLAAGAAGKMLDLLLGAHPSLADAELEDGTPAAGPETRRWLHERRPDAEAEMPVLRAVPDAAPVAPSAPAQAGAADAESDAWEVALDRVRKGRPAEGMALLQARLTDADSGRTRFLAKLQLAQLCLEADSPSLAQPLLEELASTIDQAHLETWENTALIVRVWEALYRCYRAVDPDGADSKARAKDVFARLCRLDLARAMALEQGPKPSARRWRR